MVVHLGPRIKMDNPPSFRGAKRTRILEIPGLRGACHRAALCADPLAHPGMTRRCHSGARVKRGNPESRDSPMCNCTSDEVWSFGPSRNDNAKSEMSFRG